MSKGRNPGYQPGNHWAICDRCGFAYRNNELKSTWDGLVVCEDDWEPRHPQDLLRGRADKIAPDGHVRPEHEDTFVTDPGFTDKTGETDYTVPDSTF